MRRMCPDFTVALAVAFLLMPSALTAGKAGLGDVHFPISCKAAVQSRFDYGLALLHSFEFREAEDAFRAVESDDPKCVIAAWGIALSTTERSGANAPLKDLAKGWAQLQPWLAIPAGTERERMYVDAVRAMYVGYDKTPGDLRWRNYLNRMQEIRQKYPGDINASLLYGLGLTWTAGPGKQGIQQRREALRSSCLSSSSMMFQPNRRNLMSNAIDKLTEAMKQADAIRPKIGGFPYLAETLRRAGVTRNMWSLPSCQSLFLTQEGPVVMQGAPLVTGTVDVPAFDQDALIKALRVDRAGDSTFPQFLDSTWRAGIVRYDVDFDARTVAYQGCNGEEYVEAYPAVTVG